MKFPLIFIVLIFCLFGSHGRDFKIVKATMEEWTGGLKESGKGINYRITVLVKKNSDKLKIYGIRIKDKEYDCRIFNLSDENKGKYFEKNDTILITSSIRNGYKAKSNKKEQITSDCNAELVIDYNLRKKEKCIPVNNIEKLKPKYYR